MVLFSQTEVQLNKFQIEKIEQFVKLNFPIEYKEHLLKYNGGRCIPNVFNFIEKGCKTNSCIDWFLAIYDGEIDNLKNYIKIYKLESKRLPYHILPIAHDPLGNLICISCCGLDMGSIYFWDHENEVNYDIASDDDYSNLYLIARNFNEFIENLQEKTF
jgi:hypothetical protein